MIDRDHQIGHSDFMNISNENELLSVWYGKVIPLLQEYFYNDWEKLERLLGRYSAEEQKGFIEYIAKDEIRKYFGDSDAEDYSEFSPGEIHKYKEDQIVEALKNLCT